MWRIIAIVVTLTIVVSSAPYKLGNRAMKSPQEEQRKQSRLFDTYVSHVPSPLVDPEPGVPWLNNYFHYPDAGRVPPGYSVFHPFDLGLPMEFVPGGGSIYCPHDYVQEGFMNPFDYGICFIGERYGFY